MKETLKKTNILITTTNDAEDSMLMSHCKLDHMLEKGLKILSNRKLLPDLKVINLPFCMYCITSKLD